MSTRQSLDVAYARHDGIYVQQDTAYIAGTRTVSDWIRNVNIPLGRVDTLPRYKVLMEYLSLYPEVTNLVGHSMGGSVALVAASNHPRLHAKTYGAPVISLPWQGGDRHRDAFDPISILDTGASWDPRVQKPHSYDWADTHP